jgi:hypothetical protein
VRKSDGWVKPEGWVNWRSFRGQPFEIEFASSLLKPSPDLLLPDFYFSMEVGMTLFKMFQKKLYHFTSRRKNSQTDQDK